MSIQQRNNVHVAGSGPATLMFVHGFGCDQSMWRKMAPAYEGRYRTILLDLVGSGRSDLSAYDRGKYGSLHGHASDMVEVAQAFAQGPVVFIGHSVSSMIGLLAGIERPDLFAAQVMVGPSPCYINDGEYVGGFERKDIDGLLETLEHNYLGWSSNMAPAIMGAPDQPELSQELTNSFCRTDPDIAKHFARVTFLSDHRADLPKLQSPALILQCSEDIIAPRCVGDYMHRTMPRSSLVVIRNVGHCPHMSSPGPCTDAIDSFLHHHGI
jgi:sigma-B regulation protein RsbQ